MSENILDQPNITHYSDILHEEAFNKYIKAIVNTIVERVFDPALEAQNEQRNNNTFVLDERHC